MVTALSSSVVAASLFAAGRASQELGFWSPSYCVVSCGGAPLEIVKQYIQSQRT
jgi:REP element-mobilizing transposase RayT